MVIIKVGMLVSYDYQYIYTSLPLLYADADEITIAIDKGRKMWSGGTFQFDEAVLSWIANIDTQQKIKIYQDDFYQVDLSTMENDVRERNMLAAFMGKGGWHIQVDSDEYFYNFTQFVTWLRNHDYYLKNPQQRPIDIAVYWLTLFKKTTNGFLYIKNSYESFPIATNWPIYKYSRQCGHAWRHVNFYVLHQSWARDEKEIETKINNWSHSADFNVNDYFNFWCKINETNYKQHQNIHPVNGSIWKKLDYETGADIAQFAKNYQQKRTFRIPLRKFFNPWFKEYKRRLKGRD
jgi:hypothetical protein